MSRQFIRPVTQIKTIDTFDDQIAAGSALETTTYNQEQLFQGIISQLNRFLNTSVAGNDWFADLTAPVTFEGGAIRGIDETNQDLHDLERKRVLVTAYNLSTITVPACALATGTLTGTVNFSDGDTVTIGSTVYTMTSPFVNTAFNINAATDLQTTLANLKAAINLEAGSGTLYGAGTTLHPTVDCTASDATTLDVSAKLGGTQGNAIITDSSVGDPDWGAATLAGGAGDVVVLALGELPTNTTAAIGAVSTLGTVAAYNANFGNASLAEVAGTNAISPKNLGYIEDTVTHDPILSGGRIVYVLFQTESNTDGSTMTGTTPDRAMITFVRINVGGTDLELVPSSDICGLTIHYSSNTRKGLEDLTEQDFLRGAVIDIPASVTVTRQIGYDNQGTTPVDVTTHSYLDLEGPGLVWSIRDDLEAPLFTITEGSAGGTSTVAINAATDTFDVNAAVNDFLQGITVDSGGTAINVGVTAGQIDSAGALLIASGGAADLTLDAANQLILEDGFQAASGYDTPFVLSDSSAEWDAFETAFGEVSLLNAIVQAAGSDNRHRATAYVTTNVPANTLIEGPSGPGAANISADLLDYRNVTFVDDVEIFINGVLQYNGVDAAANNDVYPSAVPAEQQYGCFYSEYALLAAPGNPDVIQMFITGSLI